MAAGSNQLQGWEATFTKPLHEGVWQAWPLKWASLAAVMTAAVLASRLTPHEMAVRFILAAGSMAVMLPALHISQTLVQEAQPCTAE